MKKKPLYRFGQTVLRPVFKLLYRYQIIGLEHIPADGPVVICSNHTAYKDPILLGLTTKRQVWFMAKKELFKNKFLAFLLNRLGVFAVERSVGISAILRGIDLLREGAAVGIFIEGTRSKTGELLKPKPGAVLLAFETKAPVVPVAIVGKDGRQPRIFSRTVIRIGERIPFEDLGVQENSPMEMRRAARLIMERIKGLRDKTLGQ